MSDDIGSYYDRKRIAGNAAWRKVVEHKSACPTCSHLGEDRMPCPTLKTLLAEWRRLSDTGD